VFERAKTVHALDCAAIVIKAFEIIISINSHARHSNLPEPNKVLTVHDFVNKKKDTGNSQNFDWG
jgi:hypothetical protein